MTSKKQSADLTSEKQHTRAQYVAALQLREQAALHAASGIPLAGRNGPVQGSFGIFSVACKRRACLATSGRRRRQLQVNVPEATIAQGRFTAFQSQRFRPVRTGVDAGMEFAVLAAGIAAGRKIIEQVRIEFAAAQPNLPTVTLILIFASFPGAFPDLCLNRSRSRPGTGAGYSKPLRNSRSALNTVTIFSAHLPTINSSREAS